MVQPLHKECRTVRCGDFVEGEIGLPLDRRRFPGQKFRREEKIGVRRRRVQRLNGEHVFPLDQTAGQRAQVNALRLERVHFCAVGGGGGIPRENLRRVATDDFDAVKISDKSIVIPHVERQTVIRDPRRHVERQSQE